MACQKPWVEKLNSSEVVSIFFFHQVKRSLSYFAMGNLANNLWTNGDEMPV